MVTLGYFSLVSSPRFFPYSYPLGFSSLVAPPLVFILLSFSLGVTLGFLLLGCSCYVRYTYLFSL